MTDILPAEGVSAEELLRLANTLERKSEHPLAKAILEYAKEQNVSAEEVADFQALPGNGLTATLDGKALCGGNDTFIGTTAPVSPEMKAQAAALAEAGKTPLWFSYGGRLLGVVAVADVIKADSPQAVRELQNMGIRVVMITGDNERTAKAIGAQAGVDQVIAGVLPDGKEREIRKLKTEGKVAMVGDGINDAPALTRADIGVAIGAGTDVAIDAADVVLMKSRLSDVPAAIRLSRATLRNIHENLFWAFFYNTIGIPLAAGVFIPLGLTLNPMFGAAAMSLSSFCVVSNALRLNLFKLRDARHDHKHVKHSKKHEEKEKNEMEKTLKITGMMCGHCEARVKKALEAVEGVAEAKVSHESGTAVVTLNVPVEDGLMQGGRPLAARFLRPHRSETAAFAKQMMERSYQMAPLRRAAAAGPLAVGDYQKILNFCVWTLSRHNGSCAGRARRKRRSFPDEKEDLCHLAGAGDAAWRIAGDGNGGWLAWLYQQCYAR